MKTYYKKVLTSEELPKESGWYFCYDLNCPPQLSSRDCYYFNEFNSSWKKDSDMFHPQWWLKKITITPAISDDEIETTVKQIGRESTAPDKETPAWLETGIRCGIRYANDRLSIVIAEKDVEVEDLKKRISDLSISSGKQLIEQDKQIERLRKLVSVMDEYSVLLGEELNETVPIAAGHGWRTSRFDAGKKMREEIEALKGVTNE